MNCFIAVFVFALVGQVLFFKSTKGEAMINIVALIRKSKKN